MIRSLLLCLLLAAPTALAQEHGHGDHHGAHAGDEHAADDDATVRHGFGDVEKWVEVFDDPERDAWQKPEALVAALQLAPGSTVADVGAGTGYMNPHLARAVGPEGRVLAVDIEPGLVRHMIDRAAREGTPQVEPRLGTPADPLLPAGAVDLVLLVDTYHHIDDRRDWFRRLHAAMRPGGRLVVVDFKAGDIPVGPPPGPRIAAEKVKEELQAAGWRLERSPDVLPYQFVQVYTRAE